MRKLLIAAPYFPEYEAAVKNVISGTDIEMVYLKEPFSDEEFVKEAKDAEIIFGQPDVELLKDVPALKWVQMQWAGVDRYTKKSGFPEGVTLTCVTGAYGNIIAEHAVAMMLSLCRHFPKYHKQQTAHVWKDLGAEKYITGSTALILGTGDLGSQTAMRMQGLGLKTIGICSKKRDIPYFDEVYTLDELKEVIGRADVLVGCLPDTPLTRGKLNKETLSLMKDDSIIVNVGRGSLIVTDDLIELLDEGKFFGVGLDVMGVEPLPADSSLWDRDNVIITPHVAGIAFGHAKSAEEAVWKIFFENFDAYLNDRPLRNVVDLKAGYAKKS